MLKEPKSSISVCLLFYISSLFGNVYFATSVFYSKVNNTNYCRLSWCCFSSHFVVSRYPGGLGCFVVDLSVDQPKKRSVANIVVLLFEALYILQLKWYYDQKITLIFSSDFETMFVKHSPSEIISVNFEKKTVNLNCTFPF